MKGCIMMKKKTQKPTLTVMSAVAGAGKSTYVKNLENVVSSDAIRLELYGTLLVPNDKKVDKIIFNEVRKRVLDLLVSGKNAVIDSTNVSIKARRSWYEQFKKYAHVHVVQIWQPLDTLLERNTKRDEANVHKNVVFKMYQTLDLPLVGTDCDSYEFICVDKQFVFDEIEKYKAISDEHNSSYHLETISEHIAMVTAEVEKQDKYKDVLLDVAKLHDLGKYVTRKPNRDKPEYDSFIGHENVSAMYAKVLGYSDEIVKLIMFHMKGHNLTDKVIKKYNLTPDFVDKLLVFVECDSKGRITSYE